jgi:hypothetical protein
MYHDRTAWRCALFVGKYMEAKDIHKETHNATLFYRGTCIQGRRHLVTAATSVVMCIPIVVRHNKAR